MSKQQKLILDGAADWKKDILGLRACPSLVSIRNEASSIARMTGIRPAFYIVNGVMQ